MNYTLKAWAGRTLLFATLIGSLFGFAVARESGAAAGAIMGVLAVNGAAQAAILFKQGFTLGAETLVADLAIVPETFVPYSVEVTAEKSEMVQSGMLEVLPELVQRANMGFDPNITSDSIGVGGQFVSMPFWNDLTGDDEVISDTGSLTTAKMTSSNERAVIHNRGKAWSHNDLAAIVAASDPAKALGERLGAYWERRLQAMVLWTLKGIFAAPSMAGNSADLHLTSGSTLTAANLFSGETYIEGQQLLGDAKDKLTTIIMHSATETALRLDDLIDFVPDSEGKSVIKTFQGARVIIDDTTTVEVINGFPVYSTFLFGRGAFGYGVGDADAPIYGAAPGSTWAWEQARETLAGQNIFVSRRRSILHPRGFKFNDHTMAKVSPTNAELAIADNWTRVKESKNVPIVRVRHNNL